MTINLKQDIIFNVETNVKHVLFIANYFLNNFLNVKVDE